MLRERGLYSRLVSVEHLEQLDSQADLFAAVRQQLELERLAALIQQLKPLDRQVLVLYLEDLDAAAIADITGLSPANVAMKIHRTKKLLARWFHEKPTEGAPHAE